MQVGGSHVEGAIGGTVDVRVTDAALLGDAVAINDGAVIVQSCPTVAVTAQCHVQAVVGICINRYLMDIRY